MATSSDGHASIVTAGNSSFGQYRLTQFVAGSGPHDATYPQHTLSSVSLDAPQMAQSSRPSSGQNIERNLSTVPARSVPRELNNNNNVGQADSIPAAGFGTLELVELASNPTLEGILGPNKDGRVRNPVPSKLKGKTDNKQGNFGVMHMGMSPGKTNNISGKDIASERDAAARRTSENTASRAKAAQQDKYAPPKRRGLEGMDNRGSPFPHDKQRASRPLAPDETKFEQARLLTLLRSINPVTVVDQICKAVAYFGGIPGAPPPEDGIFPESANTRETGALFIGWLAEIFPDLSSPEVPKMQPPPVKKVKGRPTKPELDVMPTAEAPNPRNGFGYGQAVGAPAWGLPQSLALVNTPDVVHPLTSGLPHTAPPPEQQRPLTPPKQHTEDTSGISTGKRGRGRPKGSRNKGGKSDSSFRDDGEPTENSIGGQFQPIPMEQSSSPIIEKSAQPEAVAYTSMDPPAPNPPHNAQQAYADQAWRKTNQQKSQAEQEWQIKNQRKLLENQTKPAVTGMGDEFSPEEQAVLRAFRGPDVMGQSASTAPNAVAAKGAQAGGVKRKRGPNKPKASPVVPQNTQGEQRNNSSSQAPIPIGQNTFALSQTTASMGQNKNPMAHNSAHMGQNVNTQKSNPMSMPNNNVGAIATDPLQWAPVDSSTTAVAAPAAPAPKRQRQRKPKVAAPSVGANSPSLSMNNSLSKPSSVGTATPKVPPSTIPDSQASSSQQSTQATRPPAEGLEAHYERFATHPQQNGRSHTPTITPQQQIRNQQPTSAPPQPQQLQQPPVQQQTSTQQHQMQHQKSQQGSQRDDQKGTHAAASRSSSSSGFYSQRNQGSSNFNQQYPSHQPSQLYGHQPSLSQSSLGQASPQMNSNTNSYRTTSSHTLSQASPQFSQAENTFKTASPHTIPQPSPSYTQPETTYRSSSSHTLAQPSPQFSAAENPYRTSSAHSAQPSTTYTRPASQAPSSQQGHYSGYTDNPYVDLPTLESLGHSGSSNSASVGMGTSAYGQNMNLNNASTRSGSSSLYGTSAGLNSAFDTGTNDLLRGVSRSSVSNNVYGTSSTMGNAFDPTAANDDMRERLMRNMGRR